MTSDRTISIPFMIGSAGFARSFHRRRVRPVPAIEEDEWIAVVNLGTCLGALCFLVGAYPLLPRPATRTLTVGGTPA